MLILQKINKTDSLDNILTFKFDKKEIKEINCNI